MDILNEEIKTGQDFKRMIEVGEKEELDSLKTWLFRENIRLESERSELKFRQDKLSMEQRQFQSEREEVTRRISVERRRLKQEEEFFEKKMAILKNGFAQLDEERKKFEREKSSYEARKSVRTSQGRHDKGQDVADLLFQGVESQLALKKRYKDLLKMFHPDNIAGDHEMVVVINKTYERLKREYESGKQASG